MTHKQHYVTFYNLLYKKYLNTTNYRCRRYQCSNAKLQYENTSKGIFPALYFVFLFSVNHCRSTDRPLLTLLHLIRYYMAK